MKKLTITIFALVGLFIPSSRGQDTGSENPDRIKLLIAGQGMMNYMAAKNNSDFGDIGLHLMPLAKLSDRMFIETEVEVETGEGEASFGLEQVNLVYKVSPYLNVHAGRFLPKFGGYRGRMGEAFVNRFPTDPLGFGDGGIGPMVETGIGIQAGMPLGSIKWNYDIWLSDGPQISGTNGVPNYGDFEYEAFSDNNNSKAIGGRLGLLPLSSSALEVGFSWEGASNTGPSGSVFEKTGMNMIAVDLNYFRNVSALKSTVRLLGEWKQQEENYPPLGAAGAFTSTTSALYGVIALRPSLVENNFLRNLEVAYRYSQFDHTQNEPTAGNNVKRSDIGLNYWLKWNSVIKLSYMIPEDQNFDNGVFVAQVLFGF